jgi:Holliday junction resolvase-like predicted endonuclease
MERAAYHRRARSVNRRVQGDIGEASAAEWLTSKGALVWLPFGHSPDVDLIAEFGDRLLRVQVKTSTLRTQTPRGEHRWNVSIATYGGNRSWTGLAKRFDPRRVDYLFALVGDGRRWFIPTGRIEARRAVALGGTKYSEFEVETGMAFEELVYSGRETASRPSMGEAGFEPA